MSAAEVQPSRRSAIRLGAVGAATAGLTTTGLTTAGLTPAQAAARVDHLYTTDLAEKRRALARGYRDETDTTGPLWVFAESGFYRNHRTIRLHRLVSPSTGQHFYSISAAEAALLVRHGGYRDESAAHPMWVFAVITPSTAPPGSKPLLRLWNSRTGDHLYTTSTGEVDQAARRGYRSQAEYPAPYVLTAPPESTGSPARRVHRLYRPGRGKS